MIWVLQLSFRSDLFFFDSLQSTKLESPATHEYLPALFSNDLQTLYTPLETVSLSSVIAKALQITEMPFIMHLHDY